jgi:hypothetical protein
MGTAKAARRKGESPKPPQKKGLSLYPLDLETALTAALRTGPPPKQAGKPKTKKKPGR